MTRYEPNQRYRVKIEDAALGESRNGTPQIEVGCTIGYAIGTSGEMIEVAQGRIVAYLPLTEATIGSAQEPGWVIKTLLGLGWQGRSFAALDMLPGQEVNATCRHEEYGDQVQEKWALWPERRSPAKAVEAKKVRELDSKHSALLKSFQGKAGPKTPAPAPPPQPETPPARERKRKPAPVYPPADGAAEVDPVTGETIPF